MLRIDSESCLPPRGILSAVREKIKRNKGKESEVEYNSRINEIGTQKESIIVEEESISA
jgi:hypothetical protein